MPKGATVAVTQRIQAAGGRAIESQERLRRVAEVLSQELDEDTTPNGTPLPEDRPTLTAIEAVVAVRR